MVLTATAAAAAAIASSARSPLSTSRLLLVSPRRRSLAPALVFGGSLVPLSRRSYASGAPQKPSGGTSSWGLAKRLKAMLGFSSPSNAAAARRSTAKANANANVSTLPPIPANRQRPIKPARQRSPANSVSTTSVSHPEHQPGLHKKFVAAIAATAAGLDKGRQARAIVEERDKLRRTSSLTRAQMNAQRLSASHEAKSKEGVSAQPSRRERRKAKLAGTELPDNKVVTAKPAKGKAPLPKPESWTYAAQGTKQEKDVSHKDASISGHALLTSEAASGSTRGWGRDALAPRSEMDIGRSLGEATTKHDGPLISEREKAPRISSFRPTWGEERIEAAAAVMGTGGRGWKGEAVDGASRGGSSISGSSTASGLEPTTLHFGEEATAPYRRVRKGDGASVNDGYLTLKELSKLQEEDDEVKWKVTRGGKLRAAEVPLDKVRPLREMDVPVLAHGLDRVLFNPGVYWLRDPRTGIYNFDPVLSKIPDVDLFDYAALPAYVTSSQDKELARLMRREGRRYCGSTSSLTGLLSQIYFLISAWRGPDLSGFSEPFSGMPSGFSFGATLPAAIVLRKSPSGNDGTPRYAIDADKSASDEPDNSNYVLMQLGKAMEKMLTSDTEEFERYMRVRSHELTKEERSRKESYHYAMTEKLMMRSQLDCSDPRLPNATFDLKSRAVIAIRRDRANWVESSGYMIRKSTGLLESFEREMFDMLRSAFLKYYFQARIGHMDGIFVAYHSTAAMYGFEYMPIEGMAERLFGSVEMAEQAFKLSIKMLENVLDEATRLFPDRTLRITLETSQQGSDSSLNVFVEPEEKEEGQREDKKKDGEEAVDGDAPKRKAGRSIALLQVDVDRYLDGGLVRGPVDFEAVPGRQIDMKLEDEIERRRRRELPPVQLELEWSISPRPDLSEADIRRMLEVTRSKQAALKDLILPNVSAINEREAERESLLAVNPAALARFREERESGVAPGMPRAPGQIDPASAGKTGAKGKGDAKGQGKEGENEKQQSKQGGEKKVKDEGEGGWRKSGQYISRLRRLARLGAQDKAREAGTAPVLFETRGPSSVGQSVRE